MPDWAQFVLAVLTVAGSVIGSVAVVSYRTGGKVTELTAACTANALAIAELTKVVDTRATKETASGLQAQIDRLERNDAECDGKLTAQRQESADRMERLGARLAAHEQTQSTQNTTLTAAITRVEATMEGVKDAMNRLATERPAGAHASPDLMSILGLAVQAAPLVRQLLQPQQTRAVQ